MNSLLFFTLFNAVVLFLVILDFLLLSKNSSKRRAIILTISWILCGVLFSIYIYLTSGLNHVYKYLTAYFIEKSLSIDNIFIFLLIFDHLEIKKKHQRKLLFIGIWSALFMRILMIFAISGILSAFSFMIYIFGAFILLMGLLSFLKKNNKNFATKLAEKTKCYVDIFDGDHKGRFFVVENGKRKITILTIAVFLIEISDIVFAFDSIPALFSITNDQMIIYTSNVFAIIGLRSLYIVFATIVDKIYYLKHAVGVILCFIGVKMIFSDCVHINPLTSLIIISGILLISFLMSEIRRKVKLDSSNL